MAQAPTGTAGDVVEELTRDHREALESLAQVSRGDTTLQERRTLIDTVIGEVVRYSVAEEEENNQFPRLRAHVDPGTQQKMREQVDKAKQVAPTRPHPDAPDSEVFHKLAGPGVGMIDRMRDRLTGRLGS